MASQTLNRHLASLEAVRYQFSRGEAARVLRLLRTLGAARFPDPASLIRFHEALMFLRAFPHAPNTLRKTETLLNSFHKKVEALRKSGADMDAFDTFEFAGIAGTAMEDTLGFEVARWLVRRLPGQVEIAWDNFEPGRELGNTAPRFLPLLEDDAFVEADTPWRDWLETASGVSGAHENADIKDLRDNASLERTVKAHSVQSAAKRRKDAAHGVSRGYTSDLMIQPQRGERKIPKPAKTDAWLIARFERLPLPAQQQAELYDSLRIPLRWELNNSRVTRTRNWKPAPKPFYHDAPLITRSQVSLAGELARRPPKLTRLSLREGQAVAEQIREIMLVRYRELYGTTLADPRSVVRADVGRGLEIYLWNLPPDRRLPLRSYVAGFTLKNGVPINYIEAIGLCEWMEVGFNTFYTFRGGEAGWIYAQVLRCLCHRMGTTCVSVYPYQLGHDNDEAIESGAFWFYRKLGFRPGRKDLLKLVEKEEKKIAADRMCGPGIPARQSPYRTPPRILKRLAAGHVFYELPGSEVGAWDRFSTRNIGLRVTQRMARDFGGDVVRMRQHSTRALERMLRVTTSKWSPLEKAAFENFALVLTDESRSYSWTREEKEDLVRIIRAKAKPDEMLCLHLTQQHGRLRAALLKLGS